MNDKRLICMDGRISEMTERQFAHEEAKKHVQDQIMTLFKENDITLYEAECMFRQVIELAIGRAKRETTFSQVYHDS